MAPARKLWLLAVVIAVVVVLAATAPTLLGWLLEEKVSYEGVDDLPTLFGVSHQVKTEGWYTVRRWGDPDVHHGLAEEYWVHNGLRILSESKVYRDGEVLRSTHWNPLGQVAFQVDYEREDGTVGPVGRWNYDPPWWWGAENQTPSSAVPKRSPR